MGKDNYTERETWEKYWSSYSPEVVKYRNQFTKLFERIPDGDEQKSFIELGGFPGTFAIYFKKFKGYKVSLLDYFVSRPIVNDLLRANNLDSKDIEIIESDLFKFDSGKKYDLVFSSGLIEHFEDTSLIISQHLKFLKPKGDLLIVLPNLRGVNGWVQRTFHRSNYNIHNIKSMDIKMLKSVCQSLGIENLEVGFHGKPMVWLEPDAPVNLITRKMIKLFSLGLKILPITGYFLSPFIFIRGKQA